MSDNACVGCQDAGRCHSEQMYIDCSRKINFERRKRRERLVV